MKPFHVVIHVSFDFSFVLTKITGIDMFLCLIHEVALLVLVQPVFCLQYLTTLVTLNLLPYLLIVDSLMWASSVLSEPRRFTGSLGGLQGASEVV